MAYNPDLTQEQNFHNFEQDCKIRQRDHEYEKYLIELQQRKAAFRAQFPNASEETIASIGVPMIGKRQLFLSYYVK